MNSIHLHTNYKAGVTTISNIFIDTYMPSANGNYVKVYLYLLRCLSEGGHNLTITSIADHLEDTEKDIVRALNYWEKVNLLHIERDQDNTITSILLEEPRFTSPEEEFAASLNDTVSTTPSHVPPASTAPLAKKETPKPATASFQVLVYNDDEMKALTSDEEVSWTLNTIELYLERTLRSDDIQLILNLFETYHFSAELIIHLYDYCISKGKKHKAYIEKVALTWAESGIHTPEEADAFSTQYNKDYLTIMRAFGLNRTPGEIERKLIHKWCNEFGFDLDIIIEACNRSLLKTQKPDFNYADKILVNWKKNNIKKFSDIAKADAIHNKTLHKNTPVNKGTNNNKFNAFPQRNYSQKDYSEMEKKLLEKRLEQK